MPDFGTPLKRALSERYEIERELGRGGMAVVYLARDLRHGRRVALKVLSPELAQAIGAERFLREIEIAGRLSHPRIVPLLDSAVADGLLYYAMPYVEGESLRERLQRDGQLPVDDALEIARQVASALAYAHGQGIVHRDIKPENILLSGGEALVADFGIARAVTTAAGARLTESGIAIGTPAYMSPEQASGVTDVDQRSDVYSLACVLYEMLAGEPPFTGPTVQAMTARKLSQAAPNVAIVRASIPAALADTLARALAPAPADRFTTASEFAEALRLAASIGRTQISARPNRLRIRERVLLLAAGVVAGALAVWGGTAALRSNTSASPIPVRMTVSLPPDAAILQGPTQPAPLAISPDGRNIVIAASGPDGERLYQRSLDRLDAVPLAGSEGAASPFFSPDGAWIGFFADGRLRRIPLGGGAGVDIAPASGVPGGASWGPDDRIFFVAGPRAPVSVVNAHGGEPVPVTTLEPGEENHRLPQILPDGRTLLFVGGGQVHSLDVASGRRTALLPGSSARYSGTGHLLVTRGGGLFAARFDLRRRKISGPVVPVAEGAAGPDAGFLTFAVSPNGTLAYVPSAGDYSLAIVRSDGTEHRIMSERSWFENPQFSPDGRQIAVAASRRRGEQTDIWVHDVARGTDSRLTFDGGRAPVWTPDGSAVTYSKLGEGQGIYTKPADGRADAEQVIAVNDFHWLVGWTPDRSTLAFGRMEGAAHGGVSAILTVAGDETHRILGPGSIWGGRLSPDGRWLAYYTLEGGRFAAYVARFPEGRPRWLVSAEEGRDPSWAPNGRELLYRSGERLMAARLDMGAGVRVASRRLVLAPFTPPLYDDYHMHPDGQTLVLVRPRQTQRNEVVVVVSWRSAASREAER